MPLKHAGGLSSSRPINDPSLVFRGTSSFWGMSMDPFGPHQVSHTWDGGAGFLGLENPQPVPVASHSRRHRLPSVEHAKDIADHSRPPAVKIPLSQTCVKSLDDESPADPSKIKRLRTVLKTVSTPGRSSEKERQNASKPKAVWMRGLTSRTLKPELKTFPTRFQPLTPIRRLPTTPLFCRAALEDLLFRTAASASGAG